MISYKALVAQICVLYGLIWSWMIFYEASVSKICVLFRLNDRQWSPSMPQSPKYMSYLNSMIVNVLLKSLGRTNIFILFLWSSDTMISYKASVAQICVLFRLNDRQLSLSKPRSPKYVFLFVVYDRQWSFTKPRSHKYVSYLDSMIVNHGQWSELISFKASVAQICFFYLLSMIVNDLLQSLGRTNMCQRVLFRLNDRKW